MSLNKKLLLNNRDIFLIANLSKMCFPSPVQYNRGNAIHCHNTTARGYWHIIYNKYLNELINVINIFKREVFNLYKVQLIIFSFMVSPFCAESKKSWPNPMSRRFYSMLSSRSCIVLAHI